MAGDDSQDDGERTRIGGLPPPLPKAPAAPAAPAAAPPARVPGSSTACPADSSVKVAAPSRLASVAG